MKTVEAIFNDRAEAYDKSNKFRAEEYYIIKNHLNGEVLVVGCGAGRLLKDIDAVGVDISPKMIEFAKAKGYRVKTGDAQDLQFGDKTFDVVYLPANCICYVPNQILAIKEAHRVLKPEGKLIISAHNRTYLRRLHKIFKRCLVFNTLLSCRLSALDWFRLKRTFKKVKIFYLPPNWVAKGKEGRLYKALPFLSKSIHFIAIK